MIGMRGAAVAIVQAAALRGFFATVGQGIEDLSSEAIAMRDDGDFSIGSVPVNQPAAGYALPCNLTNVDASCYVIKSNLVRRSGCRETVIEQVHFDGSIDTSDLRKLIYTTHILMAEALPPISSDLRMVSRSGGLPSVMRNLLVLHLRMLD